MSVRAEERRRKPAPRVRPEARVAGALALGVALVALIAIFASAGGHSSPSRGSGAALSDLGPRPTRAPAQPAAPKPPAPGPAQPTAQTAAARCAADWNAPPNSEQQAAFASAARDAGSGTTVAENVFVQRYTGPPIADVGAGTSGVNLASGDCMVAHAGNVVFANTDGAWHEIGVSPDTGMVDAAKRAAAAPNAHIDLATGTVALLQGAAPSP